MNYTKEHKDKYWNLHEKTSEMCADTATQNVIKYLLRSFIQFSFLFKVYSSVFLPLGSNLSLIVRVSIISAISFLTYHMARFLEPYDNNSPSGANTDQFPYKFFSFAKNIS